MNQKITAKRGLESGKSLGYSEVGMVALGLTPVGTSHRPGARRVTVRTTYSTRDRQRLFAGSPSRALKSLENVVRFTCLGSNKAQEKRRKEVVMRGKEKPIMKQKTHRIISAQAGGGLESFFTVVREIYWDRGSNII
jgi:hypothetical protein